MEIGLHQHYEVFALLLLGVIVDLSDLNWFVVNWRTFFPLNLNGVGLKLAHSENIPNVLNWFIRAYVSIVFFIIVCGPKP